ncbi:MAG: hypothetical protein B6244_06145 [Candidatus Cloacimonetes bacterium 4572_55]|nr:MAG: hypothetical protein B6244_06145 [Candidatus Cloacimonetes bacterium 4572_55]
MCNPEQTAQSSVLQPTTSPEDLAPSDQAETLRNAAEAGQPFCEDCSAPTKAMSTSDKIVAGLAAIGSLSAAAYFGGKTDAALQILDLYGKIPGRDLSLLQKIGAQEIINLPKLVTNLKGLHQMSVTYGKTGYFNIAKNNLFNMPPGRYNPSTLATRFQFATTAGRRILGQAGALGAALEVGGEIFEYAIDPDKDFLSAEFAEGAGKATVKGGLKGATGAIIIGKSTAIGAAIGAPFFGAGAVVGGAVGFVVGVGLSVGAGDIIDRAVDATWEKAKEYGPKVWNASVDKAKDIGNAIGDGTQKAWDGAKKTGEFIKSGFGLF